MNRRQRVAQVMASPRWLALLGCLQPTAVFAQWQLVVEDGFGEPNNHAAGAMAVFEQLLYIGASNYENDAQVWRSPDGLSWAQMVSSGFGDPSNHEISALAVFDGHLTRPPTLG